MQITKNIIIALVSLLLISCGAEKKQEKTKVISKEIIPEVHLKALKKAKNLEKELREAEEKRKKRMEEQGL